MISHVTEREQQMTAAIERRPIAEMSADESTTNRVIESVIVRGDISALTQQERAAYYLQICRSLGLNPAAQPLTPLRLIGKEILYASRGATDQLAAQHGINREIIDGPKMIDLAGTKLVYAVCRATHPSGRSETAVATVPLQDPANVLMKAETKAKRRATLSILGLGMLDETEIETIPAAAKEDASLKARADAVVAALKKKGVSRVTGIVAGAAAPVVDPLGKDKSRNARVEIVFVTPETL